MPFLDRAMTDACVTCPAMATTQRAAQGKQCYHVIPVPTNGVHRVHGACVCVMAPSVSFCRWVDGECGNAVPPVCWPRRCVFYVKL